MKGVVLGIVFGAFFKGANGLLSQHSELLVS
jgi:hypothetical protein